MIWSRLLEEGNEGQFVFLSLSNVRVLNLNPIAINHLLQFLIV